MKKTIVVSGINLVSGGTLSVFRDCLTFLNQCSDRYQVIALVNNKKLFEDISSNIIFLEFPLAKKAWIFRCFYEYIYFYFVSKKITPYFWFSLHDMTPNVISTKLAVYCQNASPFYSLKWSEYFLDKNFTLFTLFYIWIYRVNIKKNNYIVVQQQWLRDAFIKKFGVKNVIVAHPKLHNTTLVLQKTELATFIYPTFPRIFKNIEVICEAFKLIDNIGAKIYITIDGSENLYAEKIVKKYANLNSVVFIGLQSRDTVFDYYRKVSALIFPSKLESWGMPLSEFSLTAKPIFASDTRFCRETLAGYKSAAFFNEDDAVQLAKLIKKFVETCELFPDDTSFVNEPPYAKNWEELFDILLESK